MKIRGQSSSVHYSHQVELPRPNGESLTFTIRPLPLGFHRRLRERGVAPPQTPTRIARDSSGKPIRDESGLAVLVADEGNADYLNALDRYHQRVAVLIVAEALAADANVELETSEPPETGDWCRYADQLHAEFERAGWSAGDLVLLCQEVFQISNLVDHHIKETHANFSPDRPRGRP